MKRMKIDKFWLFAQIVAGRVEARDPRFGNWHPARILEQDRTPLRGYAYLLTRDFRARGTRASIDAPGVIELTVAGGARCELRAAKRNSCLKLVTSREF